MDAQEVRPVFFNIQKLFSIIFWNVLKYVYEKRLSQGFLQFASTCHGFRMTEKHCYEKFVFQVSLLFGFKLSEIAAATRSKSPAKTHHHFCFVILSRATRKRIQQAKYTAFQKTTSVDLPENNLCWPFKSFQFIISKTLFFPFFFSRFFTIFSPDSSDVSRFLSSRRLQMLCRKFHLNNFLICRR